MNLLKKRKPLVEMWTTVEGLTEIPECLPKPANKFIPDWLKKMKSSFDSPKDVGTIKNWAGQGWNKSAHGGDFLDHLVRKGAVDIKTVMESNDIL